MIVHSRNPYLKKIDDYELRYCIGFNKWMQNPMYKHYFKTMSRIGNGAFWYSLILTLPFFFGGTGLLVATSMALLGLLNFTIYRAIKTHVERERPFITHTQLECGALPLDRYSFPSGHTLHAVSFSIFASFYFPILLILLTPVVIGIALSRVVLALHYPSDVFAGAMLGLVMSVFAISITNILFPGSLG